MLTDVYGVIYVVDIRESSHQTVAALTSHFKCHSLIDRRDPGYSVTTIPGLQLNPTAFSLISGFWGWVARSSAGQCEWRLNQLQC